MGLPFLQYALWKISSVEGGPIVEAQYPIRGLTEGPIGGNYAEGKSLGNQHTILQFLNGKTERVKFEAVFFVKSWLEQITDFVDGLKELARADEALGRAHVCQFVWGSYFQVDCIVEQVGEIKWFDLRIDQVPRGAAVPITLLRWTGSPLVETAPQGNRETLYLFARQHETFEMIAQEKYNDPMKGILLRRKNRSLSRPDVGDVVRVLRRNHPAMRASTEPQSIALRYIQEHPDYLVAKANQRARLRSIPE